MDTPSKYQQDIYRETKEGTGNILVQAVAGAGKTTTLVGIANRLPDDCRAIFLAFNKSIQLELAERLPAHILAKTFNAYGLSILKENRIFAKLEDWKYNDIIKDLSRRIFPNISDEEREELEQASREQARMSRYNLVGCSTLDELEAITKAHNDWRTANTKQKELIAQYDQMLAEQAADYDLPVLGEDQNKRMCRLVCNALVAGIKIATGKAGAGKVIDYTDMIWLPVILKLPTTPFDYVMVDEAQDLKRCDLNLIHKAKRQDGRFVFVGDRNQSIYRFAGADSTSMDRILSVTKATELPLSICYRCPQSHIDLAASIYPGIQGKPNNPTGTLQYQVEVDWAVQNAIPTGSETKTYQDLFICRNNAPLLKIAYRLIRNGKPAKVRGKKIGEGLAGFAKRIKTWGNKNGYRSFDNYLQCLDEYYSEKCQEARETLKAEKVDAACDALFDKVETIRTIYAAKKPASLSELDAAIRSIFDDSGSTIWLSTVHKAKGLEAKRVFIVEPQLMPSRYAVSPEARRQEQNLIYVAVTRSRVVDGDPNSGCLYFLKPIQEDASTEVE